MIIIRPVIEEVALFQRGALPDGAIRLETPQSVDDMLKRAVPVEVTACAVLFAAMFARTWFSRTLVIQPLALLVGFVSGFALLPVHEWLHAIVYPRKARVTIGRLKGKIVFVALASHPMKRARFILMCLLPFVLGLLPLAIFCLSPEGNTVANGFSFGLVCAGHRMCVMC